MIKLLFVGDGPRDRASIPSLVQNILAKPADCECDDWARLHHRGSGRGYRNKLLFAIRRAQADKKDGLVATVDSDSPVPSDRIKELKDARESLRRKERPFPTALGEAVPNGDAWLLDDPLAVCDALQLDRNTAIPVVTKVRDPKPELDKIISQSSRAGDDLLQVLAEIAQLVRMERSRHFSETGFEAFARDVAAELSQL